ncbi:ATP-binding protein [Terrisporobacter vanillatitrophus]|uniref:PAS domain-containing sensor histidine kinase n=1 Tax=Terrisporobacter vanillatitrophus TaxID=3058402 RepID=UPI003EBADB5C
MIKILNSLRCTIIAINKEKQIIFANKFFLDLLGVSEEDVIGKNLFQIISISSQPIDDLIDILPEQRRFHFCIKNQNNNLQSLWGEILEDDFKGENAYFIIGKTHYDKQYTRADLEGLLDIIQVECCIKNTNREYIYVNQQFADNLGCEKSEIIGKTSRDFFCKEDWTYMEKKEKMAIDKKKIINNENIYFTTNEKKWYSNTLGPIFDENNNIKFLASCKLDITLTKFLNDTLQITLNQINQISSDISIFDMDKEYKSLIQYTIEKLMKFSKSDGISIIYFDKKCSQLKVIAQRGEVIESFKGEGFGKRLYELIDKYGEGMIQLEQLRNNRDLDLINENYIPEKFSAIGIYNMTLDKDYSGFIMLTYKKGHEDRCIPINYFKTICSYISINIANWKKFKDIKEERKKVQKINNSLMQFIDVSEDMIAIWNLDGNPIYNNYQIINILGYDNIKDLNFFDILYPDDREQVLDMMFNEDRDFGSVTSRFRGSDNKYKWIDWSYKIIREENMFFSTGRDVSERIANEKRKLLVQQAKCIEEIKDEFLSNITHEFRTPINIIMSTIQLISTSLENNTYKIDDLNEHIKYLKRNSNRLLRLVNNLIDITYIKNGYHEINLQNYNIVELVENVCNTIVSNEENNNINIIFDTDCEEINMACDADEIERILLNLLSNAIKYSFTSDPIIVSIKSNKSNVKISVKDHGIGIPKDYLDRVFDKLTRVDNNLTRHNEGSGIGLAIVKSLVNLHEGEIEVESELGKGSNFIITLPISLVNEESVNVEKIYDCKNKVEKCALEFSDIYEYNC